MTDSDLMPFGKYKGERMEKVPATYLSWIIDQPWINKWPDVEKYILDNMKVIDKQADVEQTEWNINHYNGRRLRHEWLH